MNDIWYMEVFAVLLLLIGVLDRDCGLCQEHDFIRGKRHPDAVSNGSTGTLHASGKGVVASGAVVDSGGLVRGSSTISGDGVPGEEGDVSKQLAALHKSLDDQARPKRSIVSVGCHLVWTASRLLCSSTTEA